ncbi:MAG: hypothetical protein EI684_17420 [Candidatus Viridilinea halotolerans]|uniref:Uncharacterized protein n=1 Tax=Candidatus Viridilinea halotolerans TaxID=2491704 RepID=A0A426TUA6_9CHLR|nr:MAG: hypothetical protein EI684_17420 [Candidatus Viridilinea halotolerans]
MVVSLRAPTISNQLHYQSSASDEHILVIATEESREKAFTLTLGGGTVTFDLDRDRCLFRVQVNIPRELWKISEIPMIPRFIDSASLIFREVAYSYEWIEGSEEYLSVKTNTDHDFAYIILDNPKQDINWIQLSSVFFVALTQDKLLAMLVWLDAKQIPDGGFA